MDLTKTAFGMWSGGRFMHYGEPVDDTRFHKLIDLAYDRGVRTFITADVYGAGEADTLIGRALQGKPRESYCLVGAVGHDFYQGQRDGAKGYPRFTNPALRSSSQFEEYLRFATEQSLTRCQADHFDLLLLHNPDRLGYSSREVWDGMARLKEIGLATQLGIAPGPANGFTLDLIAAMENFPELIDWAMIILNPLEPWPGSLCLAAAQATGTRILTRVVDYGGLFHDNLQPGHEFAARDHRMFRPGGWIEAGVEKLAPLREIAGAHHLTLLQLACVWCLQQPAVESIVPTLIQEPGENGKSIEAELEELAALPELQFTLDELTLIREIGDNSNCMALKGATADSTVTPSADRWPLDESLSAVAARWKIDPERDLSYAVTARI